MAADIAADDVAADEVAAHDVAAKGVAADEVAADAGDGPAENGAGPTAAGAAGGPIEDAADPSGPADDVIVARPDDGSDDAVGGMAATSGTRDDSGRADEVEASDGASRAAVVGHDAALAQDHDPATLVKEPEDVSARRGAESP